MLEEQTLYFKGVWRRYPCYMRARPTSTSNIESWAANFGAVNPIKQRVFSGTDQNTITDDTRDASFSQVSPRSANSYEIICQMWVL